MKTIFPAHYSTAALIGTLLVLLVLFAAPAPVYAGGTVTDCTTDADLSGKLVGGGTITFSCPASTVPLSSTKTITADTTIEGGDIITLSGGFSNRLFVVNSGVTLTLRHITLVNGYNPDAAGGGAVSNQGGHLILDYVTIHTMVDSAFNGGAIGTTGQVEISDSTLDGNKATNGGAVYARGTGAIVSINHSTFQHNEATGKTTDVNGFGGAIYGELGATVTVSSSDIYSNTAGSGGGIYMRNITSSLSMENVKIRQNLATNKGGGVLNDATADLTEVTLSDNTGLGLGLGGGIYNYGNLTMKSSTLNNNRAYYGGGMSNSFSSANLTNVTFSGNTATAFGGALANLAATLYLTNVTLNRNAAGSGAILNETHADTHLYLTNVIVANSTGDNCFFTKEPDTRDNNLSSDDTCDFGQDRNSVKMKLGPLETNGGQTLTHRLLPSSPAIDSGVPVAMVDIDQRGISRPQGGGFDAGAVEFVPCAGVPTKPNLLSPPKGQVFHTQTVLLDWAGPDCVKKFSVEVRRDSKQGTTVFVKTKIKPTQVMTPTLPKLHTYFWRVTACNSAGCGVSAWGKFRLE